MSFRKVYKDRNYDHVSKNLVDKIPRYQSTSSVGSEPGMEGNIILSRDTGKLCYHDGQSWNCVSASSASCVNAIYQGTTGVAENTYVNITDGTEDTIGFIGPTDANWEWAVKGVCTTSDVAFQLRISGDVCGNSYVTGSFSTTIGFYNMGAITPVITLNLADSPPDGTDIFVGKINSAGEWQWAVKVGGTGFDSGTSISVDGYGNVYVTGYFEGPVGFYNTDSLVAEIILDSGASPPTASRDVFVAKINSAGYWEWAVKAGGLSIDTGYGISTTKCGTSYVTGSFAGTAGFYNNGADAADITLTTNTLSMFLAKINSSGNWIWAARTGGSIAVGHSVSVDACENAYVIGTYASLPEFYDSGSETPNFTLPVGETFVAKISPDGRWNWGAVMDSGPNGVPGISVGDGVVYVTGTSNGDTPMNFYDAGPNVSSPSITLTPVFMTGMAYVGQINESGYWQWAAMCSGITATTSSSITVDNCNTAYICGLFALDTGFYNSGSDVSNLSLTNSTNIASIYVAKINDVGEWTWAIRAEGISQSTGTDVTVDNCGNIYVTGYIGSDDTKFYNNGEDTSSITLTSSGGFCVGKINGFLCSKKPMATVSQTVISTGDISQICFTSSLIDRQGVTPGSYYKTNSAGQLDETACCNEADFAAVSDSQIVPI